MTLIDALLSEYEPRVLEPGLWSLAPGTERYRVIGGGATVVALEAGDTIEIIDPQGRQLCEVSAFNNNGVCDPGLLDAHNERLSQENSTQTMLASTLNDARRVRAGLQLQGIHLNQARPFVLFSNDSPAQSKAQFTANSPTAVIVAAPGAAMEPHEQNPPTDLVLYIHRAALRDPNDVQLPAPLAEPSNEFIISAATAQAYEVKAGDFFQVLDVYGRQCSDFQCFAVSDLEIGEVQCLDGTITRTLIGAVCPAPGLYAKFYNALMQPLVEVVQDTVGRHDTFNTTCNPRYYEDMGYPGHINCTDNINSVWLPYGVAARRGWEAINFFYNTHVDDLNQIYFNEPWSRPGDYVLLRALQDLVCVSTACPCDIDAANGWNPTDIAIRVYPKHNIFKKATAFRMTTDSEAVLTKETGFHSRTSALSRDFVNYEGYWLPNSYRDHGPTNEYWACRQAAVAIDLSPLRKYEVLGPDAELLMQTCLTRDIRRLTTGQVVYTAMCYHNGTMIDDGTVFKLSQNNFRWIGGSDTSGLWLRQQAQDRGLQVWVKESTNQLHNLQVQGPNSRAILKKIIWTRQDQTQLAELRWFRFTIARLGDHNGIPLVVSRTGYTGELGYEIFCHPKDGALVWDAIFAAGRDDGLIPLGLEALDTLRIEAGLIFAGCEFNDQTDPYEAGIGFTVALSKNDDFIGREALMKRRDHPQRRLVGLELRGGEPGVLNDGVFLGRAQVGTVTSGTISPILRKNIALCRMAIEHAELGSQVEVGKIDGHQKRIPATVVQFSFYDPQKTRVRNTPALQLNVTPPN